MVIGITGNYGSGKSTVARMFNCTVIDVDEIGHEVLDNQCFDALVKEFGSGILDEMGTVSRGKLGDVVFSDKEKLAKLNSITHPVILQRVKGVLGKCGPDLIVIDAALLVEIGLLDQVDKVIVVKCSKQLERMPDEARVKKILSSQKTEEGLLKYADYVIDNNGTLEETREQVEKIKGEVS